MREIAYKRLGIGGKTKTSGTVTQLIFSLPYFISDIDVIPPIHILNQILATGIYDAGMSGGSEWKPFILDEQEYDEVVEDLITTPRHSLRIVDVPEWVQTIEHWRKWKWDYLYRTMPLDEYRNLEQKADLAHEIWQEFWPNRTKDAEREKELRAKLVEARRNVTDFLAQHCGK